MRHPHLWAIIAGACFAAFLAAVDPMARYDDLEAWLFLLAASGAFLTLGCLALVWGLVLEVRERDRAAEQRFVQVLKRKWRHDYEGPGS